MTALPPDAARRVAYILYVGFVLIRNMAYGGGPHLPIADLADALHNLPDYLPHPTAEDWEWVCYAVTNYHAKHPDYGWRVVRCLTDDLPEHFF